MTLPAPTTPDRTPTPQPVAPNVWEGLSERESEVARFVALGGERADVARALDMSPRTYDSHRGKVLAKLHLRNSVDLARYALRRGYVTLDVEPQPGAGS